jgi:anti-sigma factor RsiW
MSTITCQSGVDLLMDYLEGILPAHVRSALDAHVAECPRCQAFVAAYQATPRVLRNATTAPLPADVQASLLAFLRARRGGGV